MEELDENGNPINKTLAPGLSSAAPGSVAATAAPTTPGPSAPGTAGSVPSTSGIATPAAKKSGSGFTNLKQYIQANKNNTLINTVADTAQNKLAGAQGQLQQNQQQFQTQLAGEKAKLGGTVGEAAKAQSYIETGAQPLIQETAPAAALAKPEALRSRWSTDTDESYKAMQDQYNTQAKAFQENQAARDLYNQQANQAAAEKLNQLKTYQYGGPKELVGAQELANTQAGLQDYAKATGSETGRAAILQSLFGKTGQYTAGARNFDNLLLGSSQSNLDKLKALRNQTAGFGQDIRQAQQQATSEMGAARGSVDTEKANQALQMRNLRDRMYAQLQTERDLANKAGQADVGELTDAELRQNLVDKAGYVLEADPIALRKAAADEKIRQSGIQAGQTLAGTTDGQIGLPVESTPGYADSLPKDFIDLNRNMNFGAEDVGVFAEGTRPADSQYATDVNRSLTRKIAEKEGFGDFEHTSYGSPNKEQALINIQNLKPLFTQTYKDNTIESVNADLLNRRNVLSQVLADDARNGTLTPQQRSQVETQLNDVMLTGLKQTPKMAEEQFSTDMQTAAPGGGRTLSTLKNYKELGYENPLQLMKDMNFSINSLTGSGSNAVWNPKTKMIDVTRRVNIPTVNPITGGTTNNSVMIPVESLSGDKFLNKYAYTPQNKINNLSSPGLIANKLRELNILKRLKDLGVGGYTTDKGLQLGVDSEGKQILRNS